MAEWWPFDRSWADDWKRNWSEVLNMSSAAAQSLGLPQPGSLPGDPFTVLTEAARAWLVGKKRTVSFAGQELTMVLTDITTERPDLARAIGQYGEVGVTARDVQWQGHHFERLSVKARNVHLRPGSRPTLVVAPVLIETFVSAPAASRWLATVSSRLELTMQAGVPQVGVVGAPWVRLEIEPGAEGRSILVRPRALHVGDWRLSLRLPAFPAPLPALPDGLMLTAVEPAPGGFAVRGLLSEWRRPMSREDIERLLSTMRGGRDHLDL